MVHGPSFNRDAGRTSVPKVMACAPGSIPDRVLVVAGAPPTSPFLSKQICEERWNESAPCRSDVGGHVHGLLAVGTAVASAQAPPACARDFALLGEASTFNGVASADSIYLKARLKAGAPTWLSRGPRSAAGRLEDDADLSIDCYGQYCTTAATTVTGAPATAEPSVDVLGHKGAQVSIIPDRRPVTSALHNAPTQVLLKAIVFETTVFSPWWFAGGANQNIRDQEQLGDTVAATLTAFRPNGTVCGTTNLTIAGDGNAAVEIGSLGTCQAALSGSAQIAFQERPVD
jgi:hypothetical protein